MVDWKRVAGFIGAPMRTLAADEQRDAFKKQQKRQQEIFNMTDFEPTYATKQGQSPLARAYLESFLAGNNPDAIMSTAPNAAYNKQMAQANKDAMFGTNQQLLDQGAALRNQGYKPVEDMGVPLSAQSAEQRAAASGVPQEFIDAMNASGYFKKLNQGDYEHLYKNQNDREVQDILKMGKKKAK